jgi:RimJ/RimL family protein N-acetyltransferase
MNLFEGELVRLTQIERKSLPAFRRWFRDYEVQRFLAMPTVPITDEAEDAWYERMAQARDQYIFSICTLADDTLIGNCGLFDLDHKNRSAEFGIVIGEKDCWGRGFGTDATRLIVRFAFEELNLNRVALRVYDFNGRAIRAYEKAGFVHEGRQRAALFREGAYHDVLMMSVLREEWAASQRK